MQGIATLPYEVQMRPMIPVGGLGTVQSAAKMLADFGREGDTYIVHAAEGETVIPLEVLEANPRMKHMLFQQMEDMGLEPERYVVGSEFNSLNPVTGQPEFFFKKLFRGIKKIAKKVAPAVLPIALSFIAGPIYGAALGSGITTLLQGGNIKDAAKSALISGGLGALGAGIGSKVGGGGFFEGIQKAAFNPLEAAAAQREAFSSMFDRFKTPQMTDAQLTDSNVIGPTSTPTTTGAEPISDRVASIPEVGSGSGTSEVITSNTPEKTFIEKYIYDPKPAQFDAASGQITGEGTLEGIFSPSRSSLDPVLAGSEAGAQAASTIAETNKALAAAGQPALSKQAAQNLVTDAVTKASTAATDAGFFTAYGPALGAAGTAAGAYGIAQLFPDDNPDDEDQDGYHDTTGVMLYKDQPEKYGYGRDFYGDNPYYQDSTFTPGALFARGGGEINGPGTSTSDSIPAMLSDGEFVMNAKAVRGAGDGDRRAGAKRMYDMMRKFERMA